MPDPLVDEAGLVCIRPQYRFPPFDVSLQRRAFDGAGELVYGEPRPVRIDDAGRQWFHPSLLAPAVVDALLADLDGYWAIVERRLADYRSVRELTEGAAAALDGPGGFSAAPLHRALAALTEAYVLALRSVTIANLAVEDAYGRLDAMVRALLPAAEANRYLAALLRAPAARRAAEVGFTEDLRGTKRVQDTRTEPVLVFADPVLAVPHELDPHLALQAWKRGMGVARFWAIRHVAPLTVQFAEEFRYADYSIRSHMKECLRRAALLLEAERIYDLPVDEILAALAARAQAAPVGAP